jgi:hypothetical protein
MCRNMTFHTANSTGWKLSYFNKNVSNIIYTYLYSRMQTHTKAMDLFPGIIWLKRESHHSLPTSVKIMNELSYISTPIHVVGSG